MHATRTNVDWRPRPFAKELAWHYTPRRNLAGIIETGMLLPTVLYDWDVYRPQRPVIYFTIKNDRPSFVFGHHKEKGEKLNGESLRFGYTGGDLFPIVKMPHLLSVNPTNTTIEESEIFKKSRLELVRDWRVSFRAIAVDEFSVIDASDDDGETWRRIWTNPNEGGGTSALKH